MTDFPDPVTFAERIARLGGALIVEGLASSAQVRRAKESTTDITTDTDTAIQDLLVDEIRRHFPDDSILAEEALSYEGSSGRRWILDPLDGTSNFVRRLWPSVVSIGVAFAGELEIGVVFDPVHDEMFSARTGSGAFLNGMQLDRSIDSVAIKESFVSTGLTDRVEPLPRRSEIVQKLIASADSVRDLGSTALQLCYVATGRFDAHVVLGVRYWDVAAGFVIAAESGCLIEGLAPNTLPTEDGALVAVPSLVPQLRALDL